MKLFASLICFIACVQTPIVSSQEAEQVRQESNVIEIPSPTRVVGAWLATVDVDGLEIQVFEMPGNTKNVVYTAPFHFELDPDGNVDVRQISTPHDDDKTRQLTRLNLTLIRNPQGTREKIAEKLRKSNVRSDITAENVNPADVYELVIKDVTPGLKTSLRFMDYNQRYFSGKRVELDAYVPVTEASAYKKWIQDGGSRFRIHQKLYGEVVDWEQTADIRSHIAQAALSQLDVSGPVIPGDIRQNKAPYVTRKQMDEIQKNVRQQLSVNIRTMGASNEGVLTSQTDRFVDQMFDLSVVSFDDGSLWEALDEQNLTQNGIDPGKLQSFKENISSIDKSSWTKEDYDRIKIEASASFLGFGGSAGVENESRKIDNGTKEVQNSVVYDIQGDIPVPVGIELYRLSEGAMKTLTEMSFREMRTSKAITEMQMDISTIKPQGWVIRDVWLDRYPPDSWQKIVRIATGAVDPLDPNAKLEDITPPVGRERVGEWKENDSVPLQRGEAETIVRNLQVQDDKNLDYGWLLTVRMNNSASDSFIVQMPFKGVITGPLKPIGDVDIPIDFYIIGTEVQAVIRGPRPYVPESVDVTPTQPTPTSTPAPQPAPGA
jgi:hypothetical protein